MLQSSVRQHKAAHVERTSSCSAETVSDAASRFSKATDALMKQPQSAGVLHFPGTTPSPRAFVGAVGDAPRILPLLPERSGPSDRPGRSRTPLPQWRLRRVIAHIDSNIDAGITRADLAAVVGLSRMHFAAQFRAATGLRPHEFLLRRRIEHARHLLAEPRTKLVEVALSVGFQTQAHFTTVFKRIVGETPHRWRHAAHGDADPVGPERWAA